MDDRFWKIVVRLGVPGLALGVLFALFNKFNFTLSPVPKEWAGPIAIVFLTLVAGVVLVAIIKYRHAAPFQDESSGPPTRKGYRRLKVQIVAPDGLRTIERAELPTNCPWSQAANSFAVGFDLPQDPGLYKLLDIARAKWLPAPRTVGELRTNTGAITLIHADMARKFNDNAPDVAAAVHILNEAQSIRRKDRITS